MLTGNAVASFYKWGSSFYTEIPLLKYYALELTYPEDTFGDGLGKFIVNSYLCSAGEMNETPLQIECTKLSYAISDSASIDLSTAQAANLAMNSSFTEIVFAHNDDTICDDENYYKENELNIVLRDLNQYQYRYEYTDNNDESFEMCRVIVFLKLEDNASKIQTEISGIALSLSGLMISVTNYYKFNFYLRSIPYKDDNLHD